MEWVEVRGATLEAAKEEALDQLGVAAEDAEFEVVQEPENRWLGIKKTEARVRARVKPTQPRQKRDDAGRRARGRRGSRGDGRQQGGRQQGKRQSSKGGGNRERTGGQKGQAGNRQPKQNHGERKSGSTGSGRTRSEGEAKPKAPAKKGNTKEAAVSEGSHRGELVAVDEQEAMVTQFLERLVECFGVEGSVSTRLEEDIIIGSIDGPDLGLLIGPKGGTMRSIQELSRSAVQRMAEGRDTSRLMVDVAGYRDRRRAALAEFASRQAESVLESGADLALEPMSSADRKAIHDAVMEIDGVRSVSEGDDPYRKVVLLPDAS